MTRNKLLLFLSPTTLLRRRISRSFLPFRPETDVKGHVTSLTLTGLNLRLSRHKVIKGLNRLSQTKPRLRNLQIIPIQWRFPQLHRLRSSPVSSLVQPNESFRARRVQLQSLSPIEMLRIRSTVVLLRIPTWPHANATTLTRSVTNTQNLRGLACYRSPVRSPEISPIDHLVPTFPMQRR